MQTTPPPNNLSSKELMNLVVAALNDMKSQAVMTFDVRHLTSITDYMVMASGRSDRHVRSLSESVLERAKLAGEFALGVEGQESGEWVLVDLNGVVVHVMIPRVREFYNLEKLWDMGPGSEVLPR